ncbi:hypothetical protein M433DRAFT_135097 [Acidomyces richmondensis BFW]|nr:MAG: hypothetical protein FE78DRAFT_71688 [Acidomyces sp. 'richmondensis']KYG44987.1 hypothetical protein M433DRAFT_135097 [Acidomyces richmondensis BFW]
MASQFARRPMITAVGAATILSAAVYVTSRPSTRLDSAANPPSHTLSFPKNMLFARDLQVTKVEQVNHDTKRITLQLPGGPNEVSGVPFSSAVLTQHTAPGAWLPILRPYTPVSDSDARGVLQFVVKKYPNGRASGYMHSLEPGQYLRVRGPLPGYTYKPSEQQERDVILVAGGAGITPIYSLAKGILSNPTDKTRIHLLWGVNGMRDIVLKSEMEELEFAHPDRFRVTYAVSGSEAAPDASSLGDVDKYRKGYVNKAMLEEVIARCQKGSWGDEKGTKIFLCGPPKMETALAGRQGVFGELGIAKKEIHRF